MIARIAIALFLLVLVGWVGLAVVSSRVEGQLNRVAEGPLPEGAYGELIGLLREVSKYGWERLRAGAQKPASRRGGRRRRKTDS